MPRAKRASSPRVQAVSGGDATRQPPLKASPLKTPPKATPLKATPAALTLSESPSPERQRREADRVAALESEVRLLRQQLQQQSVSNEADLTSLRSGQALRHTALEDGLRSEAGKAERALSSHFAEEVTAQRLRAAAKVQSATASAAAASSREMIDVRLQMKRLRGVVLLIGPPCAGKSRVGAALSAKLGAAHCTINSLIEDASHEDGPEGDVMRAALIGDTELPPAVVLQLMSRALSTASSSTLLLLLEVPANCGILPSLLLDPSPPSLLLFVQAPDRVCVRRIIQRASASGRPWPTTEEARDMVSTYRSTDEQVACAIGGAYPGRLYVVDCNTRVEELASAMASALHAASCAPAVQISALAAQTTQTEGDASKGGPSIVDATEPAKLMDATELVRRIGHEAEGKESLTLAPTSRFVGAGTQGVVVWSNSAEGWPATPTACAKVAGILGGDRKSVV